MLTTLVSSAAPAWAGTTAFTTPGEHEFVVPRAVTSVHVVAIGGRGGDSPVSSGANGGKAIADLAVTHGRILYAEVGGNGLGGAGGSGGGGAGGADNDGRAGGGGGGGGYYGGGGGAAGETCLGPGGGGRRIRFFGPGTSNASFDDLDTSNVPSVTFTYISPPTIVVVSPVAGSGFTQHQVVPSSYSCTAGAGTTLQSCIGPIATGVAIDTSTSGLTASCSPPGNSSRAATR